MNVIEILSEDIAITYLCFAAMDDHTDEAMVETHFEKRKPRQKRTNFAIFSLFLKHILISMQFNVISASETDMGWVSLIFTFIWPVLTDMWLIFTF